MVKFQIMSDLHIETLSDNISVDDFVKKSADILILAGDIGRVHKYEQVKKFLKELCEKFEIVLYVLGNHEYYRVDNVPPKNMEQILADLETIRSEIPNLYILNRNSVIVEDVCIVGCTLWSQATLDVPPYIVRIPEMDTIKYNSLFKEDLYYIERMITYCQEKNLKLLVVTHHCPTYVISKRKATDKYKSLYCSNLDYLLDSKKVHTWICGHVHTNFDMKTRNGTRLVSNQKGKPKDKVSDYLLDKVITV
jgi:Icc-related predicted phosphoesterase